MASLIAQCFIWDELTFPKPRSTHSGLRWVAAVLAQLIYSIANLLYWRVFMLGFVTYVIDKRRIAFARFLVGFAVVAIGSIVASIYACLVPIRLSRWRATRDKSHLLWLLVHAVLGHLVVLNILVHFMCGVLRDPGRVPQPLPLEVSRTMCSRCQLPRPLRSHHCGVCGRCVLRMDHHCPWLNNCVGLRTHRHFYLLLVYLWIGIVYLYFAGWRDFMSHVQDVCSDGDSPTRESETWTHFANCVVHRLLSALFKSTVPLLAFITGLLIWHGFLISRGETFIEYYQNKSAARILRRHRLIFRNPFDFGAISNWLRFLGIEVSSDEKVIREKLRNLPVWTYVKRTLLSVVLLLNSQPFDGDGLEFKTCEPDIDRALRDLALVDDC
uniref:Palmitoyltransferase n=1 Tax=Mesocestoides corti TaxID=53468 RepID=A0A5K3G0E0_MESCO